MPDASTVISRRRPAEALVDRVLDSTGKHKPHIALMGSPPHAHGLVLTAWKNLIQLSHWVGCSHLQRRA